MYYIVVLEISVFVRPHVNDKLTVLKVHSETASFFGARKGRFRVDRRLKIP